MKLYTIEYQNTIQPAAAFSEADVLYPLIPNGIAHADMQSLIENWSEALAASIYALEKKPDAEKVNISDIRIKAPIIRPRQDVICLGINYYDHATEAAKFSSEAFGGERPKTIYFSKRVTEAPGTGDSIPSHSDVVKELDYESELAVILGKTALNVSKENALDYVFGYTIINDVTAREVQTAHKQWYRGKSFDGFTPMGPCIVTADDIPDPQTLKIYARVNGETRQESHTSLMMQDVAGAVSELSSGMTLLPGTIISTGTPAGVGMGFNPPKFLKHGDVVECEVERIGTLINTID